MKRVDWSFADADDLHSHYLYTEPLKLISFTECNVCEGDLPLRKEGIDNSVSQRIDGQLWDPLEIFSTAGPTKF